MTSAPGQTSPSRDDRPIVRVRELSISFSSAGTTTSAVQGVSFDIWPGHVHALVGESGSGKSATARSLVGLNGRFARTSARELTYRGHDLRQFVTHEWRQVRGREIGLVQQDALQSLHPLRTVGHELAEAGGRTDWRLDDQLRAGLARQLERVGIPDGRSRLDQYPHQLSGGLRQRVLIATALARDPRLVIADEPTTALDTTIQREIIDLLLRAVRDQGRGLLLISHDLSLVADVADTVSVLESGRIVESGATRDVLTRPTHAYTRQLLRAVPSTQARGRRLSAPVESTASAIPPLPRSGKCPGAIMVEVRGLRQTFVDPDGQRRTALDGVSLNLREGETVGVVGESGSGKSTLLRSILGLTTPTAGEVLIDGRPWNPARERDRRPLRHQLQLISQDPLGSFDPRYTAGRVIRDGVRVAGLRGRAAHIRAAALADAVKLSSASLTRNPRELSGGQRQRVAIARALGANPRLLLCDEPVSALDVSVQAQVLDLLEDVRDEFGTAIVFVSHDLGVVYHISDRVLVLKDGSVVETGDVVEVYRDPQHPYTRRLLDAVPRLAAAESPRAPSGHTPSPNAAALA